MAKKFTPGPWNRTPGERAKHDQSAGITGGDNGHYIACALDMNRTDKDDEVEANARLIATAPELLEALGSITNELSHLFHNGRILANAPERDRIQMLILNAEHAIEKAIES